MTLTLGSVSYIFFAANASIVTALGSNPASAGTLESEQRQMKQC